jgi:hypothetical protein
MQRIYREEFGRRQVARLQMLISCPDVQANRDTLGSEFHRGSLLRGCCAEMIEQAMQDIFAVDHRKPDIILCILLCISATGKRTRKSIFTG